MSLTMISSNVAGYTKKQLTGAILFTGYCVGELSIGCWSLACANANQVTSSVLKRSRAVRKTSTRRILRKLLVQSTHAIA